MPRLRFKIPSYRLHKARGLAVVTLDGQDHYLGAYDSAESRAEYNRLIADWLKQRNTQLPQELVALPAATEITIIELIAKYLEHSEKYYVHPDGTQTGELWNIKTILQVLEELYCTTRAIEFGPLSLKTVRDTLIEKKWARKTINKQIGRIKAMFRWAVENELIPGSVLQGLIAVRGLRKGRTAAKELDPVTPVDLRHVEAIKPYVSSQVWAMIHVQLLTGMRPGEVVIMRTCDLERTNGVWTYTPQKHKTEHHEKSRPISIGPKAQLILTPFLKPNLQAYIFSPIDAEAERRAKAHLKRKTPLYLGNAPGTNRKAVAKRSPRERYTVATYRRAIQRACERADKAAHKTNPYMPAKQVVVEIWHPHQLRHNAGTLLRQRYGLETARAVLGHSTIATTEIYAEADFNRVQQVMAELG